MRQRTALSPQARTNDLTGRPGTPIGDTGLFPAAGAEFAIEGPLWH